MVVLASEQSKRTLCIALYNRALNKSNLCPANYQVNYDRGWFSVRDGWKDEVKFRRPDITAEADKLLLSGNVLVYYSAVWNSYVLR